MKKIKIFWDERITREKIIEISDDEYNILLEGEDIFPVYNKYNRSLWYNMKYIDETVGFSNCDDDENKFEYGN